MTTILKRALAVAVFSILMPSGLFGTQAVDPTHPPAAAELEPLQGIWEGFMAGNESGPMITVTITGNSLRFYRDPDFWFETTFTLPAGTYPQQLHATIKDCVEPCDDVGKVVYAIFKIEGAILTLVGIQATAAEPPQDFGTIPGFEDNRRFRYVLKKAPPSLSPAPSLPR